jgi:hypothetical protein
MSLTYKHIPLRRGVWVKCTDAVFSADQYLIMPFRPRQGEYYSIRQFNRTYNPVTDIYVYSVLLNEIINPAVRMITNGEVRMVEPSFKLMRFTVVAGVEETTSALTEALDILNIV